MKNKQIILAISGIVILIAGYLLGSFAPANQLSKVKLKSAVDSFSYAYGLDMGNFLSENIDQFKLRNEFSSKLFLEGANAGYNKTKPVLEDFQASQVLQSFITERSQEMEMERAEKGSQNLEKSNAFLELNKTKEGVITTASGLQYKIIKEGNGDIPKQADEVVVHYKGTLIDGTQFDSSYDRGEPAIFPVTGVISGWTEILQLMKTGSQYQVFIPPDLGYGERGAGNLIEPNSVLIFDMELLEIKK